MPNPYAPPPTQLQQKVAPPSRGWLIPIGATAISVLFAVWAESWDSAFILGVVLVFTCAASWFTRTDLTLNGGSNTFAEFTDELDADALKPRFIDGQAIVFCGIAFFVDPDESSRLYAASPTATNTIERMQLITSEVIRHLPHFLAEHQNLHKFLQGRKIVVRMVESYAGLQTTCLREDPIDWDILSTALQCDTTQDRG
ncbi:hypothetical protein Poly51_44250 [Rubripirellula tenax]|uniref:Uncharacterized protein n=1 Tax=Rubripirellula tenax TaxID=2528015 RepID=A0A5C6EJD2_9BACT|nr:hypothetical protein [Rubripirellula tenax]TWU48525.1 hypothetical protein Poly51_44250 [Rubripirellula tenax]